MDVNDLGGYFGSFAVTEVEAATPTRALGDRVGCFIYVAIPCIT